MPQAPWAVQEHHPKPVIFAAGEGLERRETSTAVHPEEAGRGTSPSKRFAPELAITPTAPARKTEKKSGQSRQPKTITAA